MACSALPLKVAYIIVGKSCIISDKILKIINEDGMMFIAMLNNHFQKMPAN